MRTMASYKEVRRGVGGWDKALIKFLIPIVAGLLLGPARLLLQHPNRSWKSGDVLLPGLFSAGLALTILTHGRSSILAAYLDGLFVLILSAAIGGFFRFALPHKRVNLRQMDAMAIALAALFLACLNVSFLRYVGSPQLDASLLSRARIVAERVPINMTLVVDSALLGQALSYPTNRRIEDFMIRDKLPKFLPTENIHHVGKNEFGLFERRSLEIFSGAGPARNKLESKLLATGALPALREQLCVIDGRSAGHSEAETEPELLNRVCS